MGFCFSTGMNLTRLIGLGLPTEKARLRVISSSMSCWMVFMNPLVETVIFRLLRPKPSGDVMVFMAAMTLS